MVLKEKEEEGKRNWKKRTKEKEKGDKEEKS